MFHIFCSETLEAFLVFLDNYTFSSYREIFIYLAYLYKYLCVKNKS